MSNGKHNALPYSSLPLAVREIGRINLSGNITPTVWYQRLRFPPRQAKGETRHGLPNATAVAILSEIVYWYRPVEIREPTTGALLGYSKKFQADILQRSYQSFVDQFGFTKEQVRDACQFLERWRLITMELRNTTTESGTQLNNVVFIRLHAGNLARLTDPEDETYGDPYQLQSREPINFKVGSLPTSNPTPPHFEVETNTETTTKILSLSPASANGSDPLYEWLTRNAADCIKVPQNFILSLLNSAYRGVVAFLIQEQEYKQWILAACIDLGAPSTGTYRDWLKQLNCSLKESRAAGRYISPIEETNGAKHHNGNKPKSDPDKQRYGKPKNGSLFNVPGDGMDSQAGSEP